MTRIEQIISYANSFKGNGVENEELKETIRMAVIDGALWADAHQNHWHEAQGDDLPEIDREVIVLRNNGQIAFGHRPNPDGEIWKHPDGTLEHVHFKTYDKGGWNIPNVKWWLDLDLPKMQE